MLHSELDDGCYYLISSDQGAPMFSAQKIMCKGAVTLAIFWRRFGPLLIVSSAAMYEAQLAYKLLSNQVYFYWSTQEKT